MENKVLVSVDMITYMHEAYITQAIEGVLMQETNFEYELIIADDCSPDNTEEVVRNIIATHPKGHIIKYFRHEKNLGMHANGVFAGGKCNGKYIAICEGDDYWTDRFKLQKQVDFLENNSECVISYHNCQRVNEKGDIFGQDIYSDNQPKFFNFVDAVNGSYTKTCTITFRNILDFNTIGYLDDIILCLELLKIGGFAGFISDNMAAYRYTYGGVWSRVNTFGKFLLQEKTELHINSRFQNCEHKKFVNRRLINFYKIWAKLLIKDLFFLGFTKAISKYIKYETKRIIYKS